MENQNNSEKPRKRSLTELTLGWLAERMRKAEKIKTQIQNGSYQVDNDKVASAIINKPEQMSSK